MLFLWVGGAVDSVDCVVSAIVGLTMRKNERMAKIGKTTILLFKYEANFFNFLIQVSTVCIVISCTYHM
jgi:hypothetical protein